MQAVKLKAWWHLFRPWSYTATVVPFLVGAVFATAGDFHWSACEWGRWTLGLAAGFLFQATVNLLNTWGDERSGVDSAPGAIRTTPEVHEGLITLPQVLTAALACAVTAAGIGLFLCFYTSSRGESFPSVSFCYSLFAAGIWGALGSVNYSTGIKFKYHGLGVPFVSWLMGPLEIFVAFAIIAPFEADIFMRDPSGPAGVLGALALMAGMLFLAMPIALLVGVIMHGNDMRDIFSDRAAGIKTLASWLGPRRALWYYGFCHLGAHVWMVALAVALGHFMHYGVRALFLLLPLLVLPLSLRTLRTACRVYRECPEHPPWRGLERSSGAIHFAFGVLYALALYLAF